MLGEVNKWSGGKKEEEKTWAGTKYIRPFSHQHTLVSHYTESTTARLEAVTTKVNSTFFQKKVNSTTSLQKDLEQSFMSKSIVINWKVNQ